MDFVSVASSFSNDCLYDGEELIDKRVGGPALFIINALQRKKVPLELHTGLVIDVDIRLTVSSETGRILTPPTRRKMSSVKTSKWTIVSTILDEWKLDGPVPEYLFLDIQGYVRRAGSDYGAKRVWQAFDEVQQQIFCMKGTEEELALVPADIIECQKSKLLIVTKGSAGADLYAFGRKTSYQTEPIKGLPDTIGAGDSFLGFFVAEFIKSQNPSQALQQAGQDTRRFLENKL